MRARWLAVPGAMVVVVAIAYSVTYSSPSPLGFVEELREFKSFREVYSDREGEDRYSIVYGVHLAAIDRARSVIAKDLSAAGWAHAKGPLDSDAQVRIEPDTWSHASGGEVRLSPRKFYTCGTCAPPWRMELDEVEIHLWLPRPPSLWERFVQFVMS